MTLRFLLDEGLPMRAAASLREGGVEAWHVNEIGLRSAPDPRILAEAVSRGAVIVCYDSDFHRHLAESGASLPSVMRLRVDPLGPEQLAGLVLEVASSAARMLGEGAVLSVTEGSVRGRLLPLKQ